MSENIQFDEVVTAKNWDEHPELKLFFNKMSTVELWVLDGNNSVKTRIINWVEKLDPEKLDALKSNLNSLLTVLAFSNVGAAMYLLSQLEIRVPGITNSLANRASSCLEDPLYGRPSRILIERLSAAHTQVSLKQLLNNKRLGLVYSALKAVEERTGGLV